MGKLIQRAQSSLIIQRAERPCNCFYDEKEKTAPGAKTRSKKADLAQNTSPHTLLALLVISGRCHIRQGQGSSPLNPLWFLELFGSFRLKHLGQGERSLPWCPGSRFWWFICNLGCWKGVSTWGRAAGAEQCLGTQIPPVWTPFFAQAVGTGCGCRDWVVPDVWKAATVLPWQSWAISLNSPSGSALVYPLCPFLRELS